MSKTIEAVADAIWLNLYGDVRQTDAEKRVFSEIARAAIGAMREPSDEMVEATGSEYGIALEETWQKMIDAALE